jgi:hypothetical protein
VTKVEGDQGGRTMLGGDLGKTMLEGDHDGRIIVEGPCWKVHVGRSMLEGDQGG